MLWEALLKAGPDVAAAAADELAAQVRSTARFLEFTRRYCPPPPGLRPSPTDQVDWSKMRKHLQLVYKYRSKSLHSGLPFPQPICSAPYTEPNGYAMEVPFGISAGAVGAVWMANDLPIHLHVFAYITRGALLGWWRSLTAKDPAPAS